MYYTIFDLGKLIFHYCDDELDFTSMISLSHLAYSITQISNKLIMKEEHVWRMQKPQTNWQELNNPTTNLIMYHRVNILRCKFRVENY